MDPEPASRALLRRLLEADGRAGSVTSTASVAHVPADQLTRPLTLVLSSAVDLPELSLLAPLLADPGTHVVLVLSSLAQGRLGAVDGVLADAVVRAEDLSGPAAPEVLTARGRGTVAVAPETMRHILHLASGSTGGEVRRPRLTERETQTLCALAQGLSNRQIARDMGITEHGVKRHVASILAKLNCQNRTTAVAIALRSGLLHTQTVRAG
ncbi:response regulator transcription factor [Streptomyces sp. OE57]|uniref:helix-turn-helix transcriptional regulator n=1 Tax=Streptomyces lacaronensis TaxID=3379885 RepID=UPI0039B77EE6